MIVVNKNNETPYESKNEDALIKSLYLPLLIQFQQTSDLLESLVKTYANDVRRYDRAVGSKTFNKRLKAEFTEKFAAGDENLIALINEHHPTLTIKAG